MLVAIGVYQLVSALPSVLEVPSLITSVSTWPRVSLCLEPVVKHEAYVFDISGIHASKTRIFFASLNLMHVYLLHLFLTRLT